MERTANKDEICLPLLIVPSDKNGDDHQEESCQKKKKNTKDDDDSQKKQQQRVLLIATAVVGYPLLVLVVLTSLGLVSVLLYQPSWPTFFFTPSKPTTTTAAGTETSDTTNHTTTWWSDNSSSSVCWSMVTFFASSMLYRYTLWYAAVSNQPDGAGDWIVPLHVLPELVTLWTLGLCWSGQAETAAIVFLVGKSVMFAAAEFYWIGQLVVFFRSWCQPRRHCRKTMDDDCDEAAAARATTNNRKNETLLSTTTTDGHAFDKNSSGHAVEQAVLINNNKNDRSPKQYSAGKVNRLRDKVTFSKKVVFCLRFAKSAGKVVQTKRSRTRG
jgi:hypothetical protein